MEESSETEIFKQVIENSFDSAWVLSLPQFQLIYANKKSTEKLFGYPIERFYENPGFWLSIVHPEDQHLAMKANKECLLTGNAEARYRMIKSDGSIVWLFIRLCALKNHLGEYYRIIGNSMDVTLDHLKEKQLRESEELFQSLANFAPIGIYRTDPEGRSTYVNKLWAEIAGLSQEEALGDDWTKTIHPDDKEKVFSAWKKTASQNENFNFEYRFNNPETGTRYVSSRAVPIQDTDGKVISYVGTIEDITERIKSEKTLDLQKQKLVASAKMSSLGEMASGIAHEINNPLMIIIGLCVRLKRFIERGELDHDVFVREVNKIESTSFRISKIINGLRAFTRNSENDQMNLISVNQIVEETLELCRQRFADHAIELRVDLLESPDIKILSRPSQISQVLLNLLGNSFDAVEFLPEKWVEVKLVTSSKWLFIEVTDSGNGIPAHVVDKIMNPFFTTKEVGKGTGLGLSISQGIIDEHKGKLFYDAESSHTKFIVQLPLAE